MTLPPRFAVANWPSEFMFRLFCKSGLLLGLSSGFQVQLVETGTDVVVSDSNMVVVVALSMDEVPRAVGYAAGMALT